jgi:hypothetical protein
MKTPPVSGEIPGSAAAMRRHQATLASSQSFHRNMSARANFSVAERVAVGMISRHGANAARAATVQLNRMIDRGNWAARDLWACVVHVIHQWEDEAETDRTGGWRAYVKNREWTATQRAVGQ